MRHGVTLSLIYQFQHLICNIFTRQNRGNIQTSFLPVALLHCTHTQGCTKLFITERRAYSQLNIYIINHSATYVV